MRRSARVKLKCRTIRVIRSITNVGSLFVISVRVTPPAGFASFFVEEILPLGFLPVNFGGDGLFDALSHRLLWGPLTDGLPHTLAYTLQPPAGFEGAVTIAGSTYFFSSSVVTIGQNALLVAACGFPGRRAVA